MYNMRAQLQTVSMKMSTMKATAAMNEAMAGATKALSKMNAKMSVPEMQKIVMEFQRQCGIADTKQEMMEDSIQDIVEGDVDEESEEIINQTLEEIGVNLGSSLPDVPAEETVMKDRSAQKARPKKVAVADGVGAVPSKKARVDDDSDEEMDNDEEEGDQNDSELEARINALN